MGGGGDFVHTILGGGGRGRVRGEGVHRGTQGGGMCLLRSCGVGWGGAPQHPPPRSEHTAGRRGKVKAFQVPTIPKDRVSSSAAHRPWKPIW